MMSEVADETFVINLKTRQRSTSLQCYNFFIIISTKLVVFFMCIYYFIVQYLFSDTAGCPVKVVLSKNIFKWVK